MPQPLVLPCCIEAPPGFVPRARYAVRVLLAGLGAAPRWVDRAYLEGPALYYGTAPEGLKPSTVVVPLDPATPAYFDSGVPYPVGRMFRGEFEGGASPVLFGTPEAPDRIASAFFWLSGWQEHTTRERDVHGRFPYEASLQAAWGIACDPPVDAYREWLAAQLAGVGFHAIPPRWAGHDWAFCATHDIDYDRKWRPGIVYRELVEYPLLNRLGMPPSARMRRLAATVRQFIQPGDPFRQALVRMREEVRTRAGRATYFFKAGAHGPHDVPYRLTSFFMQRQFERLRAEGFEIGLHPGYHAHDHAARMEEERTRLARAAGMAPVAVRQHYLRWEAELTPELHSRAGFQLDSTLGFSTHEGFRHGTCHPFPLYDIAANTARDLWEVPLCLMEAAVFNRRKLDVDAALEVSRQLIDTCRRYRGVCVMLWHNTLWDEIDFPGWGRHFVDTLDTAREAGGCLTTLSMALETYR